MRQGIGTIYLNHNKFLAMGMYDTIRSSYDLGPDFYNRTLQTKDLECFMAEYWIDPVGRLFEIDYSGTQDLQDYESNKNIENSFLKLPMWVPNGNHGKVKPVYLTKTIEVYPQNWSAHYAPFPRKEITFFRGVLITEEDDSHWEERYKSLKRWVKEHYLY